MTDIIITQLNNGKFRVSDSVYSCDADTVRLAIEGCKQLKESNEGLPLGEEKYNPSEDDPSPKDSGRRGNTSGGVAPDEPEVEQAKGGPRPAPLENPKSNNMDPFAGTSWEGKKQPH